MLDPQFTSELQAYLDLPADEAPIADGAMLLLRINGNRAMYSQILRRSLREKLLYELRKHLLIRLDGHTRAEVARMEPEVIKQVDQTLAEPAKRHGRRADHDSLPPKIQKLYDANIDLWKKIKAVRAELEQMQGSDYEPCDRYERCKALRQADELYHRNWHRYDTAEPEVKEAEPANK